MINASLQDNRRDFLRTLMVGFAATLIGVIDTDIGFGQAVNAKRHLAEELLASKYLPEDYSKASAALLEFDNLIASDKPPEARDALSRAATIICDAFAQLSNDAQFWATLGGQRETIGKNSAQIKQILGNLEKFLPEEDKALQPYMAPGPRMRLVSNLSLALSRFRNEPNSWNLEDLRSRVQDSNAAVCGAAKSLDKEPLSNFISDIRIVGHSLGVLGGSATIVVNAIGIEVLPVALASIVGGVATIIDESTELIAEIKLRKPPRLM